MELPAQAGLISGGRRPAEPNTSKNTKFNIKQIQPDPTNRTGLGIDKLVLLTPYFLLCTLYFVIRTS